MLSRRTTLVWAVLIALATPAFASFGERPASPSAPPKTDLPRDGSAQNLSRRQQAEQWYGEAYDEVARAKKDLADGKSKAIDKHWKRAIERAEYAAEMDTTYHEAWNLIGFASRKLGEYPKSLAAYRHCLRVAPMYAPAREYFGEALLETGDVIGAREQAHWLHKLGADSLAAELDRSIVARAGADKPDSTASN